MLDKTRPFDIAGTKNRTLWKQDGVYYDPSSGQEVDPSAKPPQPPVKASEMALTCKFCGAKRDDLGLMKEHLLAMHRDEVPELLEKPEDKEPTDATEPDLDPEMTIAKIRAYAEKHNIDVSKLTRKADIVAAIRKGLYGGLNK